MKAKDQRTVIFALIQRPLDKVLTEVTQSDLSAETPTRGENVTPPEKKIESTDKIHASANEQLWRPPPDGPYSMSALWDDGPYRVASFFQKANYRVRNL